MRTLLDWWNGAWWWQVPPITIIEWKRRAWV